MRGRLEIFESTAALQRAASERIVARLDDEIRDRGQATLALSGGATPKGVYELLGSEKYRSRLPWSKVHLFWGDERCVGPTMPESNFRMAKESLIRNIAIPPQNIHRIRGEAKPHTAAQECELEIRRFFGLKNGEFPRLTLVLLGIGEDGHTASLFPGTAVLDDNQRIVADVFVEKLAASRITLTLPTINNAATVLFLVAGRTKAAILQQVFADGEAHVPAQRINPASGELFWFVDTDAASQLPKAVTL